MNANEQLSRMKSLMNYGLQTESKQPQYSSVEYKKLAADGKTYGIVREGTKFFIKVANNKPNLVKEDFQYIGGFRNRKENEYSNYALAQKQFDLKMMSIKEAYANPSFDVESWDLSKKENVVVEASEKMKDEILRERQIMKNAMAINEKKNKAMCCDVPSMKKPKNNIKKESPKTGDAEDAVEHENPKLPKEMTESVMNEEEVLGWNRDDDYMDKSHGTEIGNCAPFNNARGKDIDDSEGTSETGEMKNGVVENHHKSMHSQETQDTPSVGVGEGSSDDNNKPFDDEKGRQIDEAIDDFDTEGEDGLGDDIDGFGAEDEDEFGDEGDDFVADDEFDGEEVFDDEDGDDIFEDDLESRVSAMEDILNKIAAKLGVEDTLVDDGTYDDGDLYGDEEVVDGDEEVVDDTPMESKRRKRGFEIYESKGYRNAMRRLMNEEEEGEEGEDDGENMSNFNDGERVPKGNMNKLDDFGKHPAYQKTVMKTPPKDMKEPDGYYDMNDESLESDEPYGEKIGDGSPFKINTKSIDNAIAEAIRRFKKKI